MGQYVLVDVLKESNAFNSGVVRALDELYPKGMP